MKAMLMNSLWLMLERVSLSLSGIFVSVYVARYLGPAQYGLINYLLSVIAIAVPLVQLGADAVLFNRVARRRHSGIRLMLASMRLRRQLFALIAVPLMAWALLTQDRTSQIMMALMLISHNPGVLAYATENLLVLRHGDCVESGPTRQVLTAPSHPYTRGLLEAIPRGSHRQRRLPMEGR